jgi:hypothetical protein
MFTPDPRPKPEDVGCTVWKQCEDKCGECKPCNRFALKLRELLPNDVGSAYRRHTFEWVDK